MKRKFHNKFVFDLLKGSVIALACVAFSNCGNGKGLGNTPESQAAPFADENEMISFLIKERNWDQARAEAFVRKGDNFERLRNCREALSEVVFDENENEEQVVQKVLKTHNAKKSSQSQGETQEGRDQPGVGKAEIKIVSGGHVYGGNTFFVADGSSTLKVNITGVEGDFVVDLQGKDGNAFDGLANPVFNNGNGEFSIGLDSTHGKTFLGVHDGRLVVWKKGSTEEICKVDLVVVDTKEGAYFRDVATNDGKVNNLNNSDLSGLVACLEEIGRFKNNGLGVWEKINGDLYSKFNLRFEGEAGGKKLCWGENKVCTDVRSNLDTVVTVLNKCQEVFEKCPKFVLDRSTIDLTKAKAEASFISLKNLKGVEVEGKIGFAKENRGNKGLFIVDGENFSSVVGDWEANEADMKALLGLIKKFLDDSELSALTWVGDFCKLKPTLSIGTNDLAIKVSVESFVVDNFWTLSEKVADFSGLEALKNLLGESGVEGKFVWSVNNVEKKILCNVCEGGDKDVLTITNVESLEHLGFLLGRMGSWSKFPTEGSNKLKFEEGMKVVGVVFEDSVSSEDKFNTFVAVLEGVKNFGFDGNFGELVLDSDGNLKLGGVNMGGVLNKVATWGGAWSRLVGLDIVNNFVGEESSWKKISVLKGGSGREIKNAGEAAFVFTDKDVWVGGEIGNGMEKWLRRV